MRLLDTYRSRGRYDITVVTHTDASLRVKTFSRKGYSPVKTWLKRITASVLALLILAGVILVGAGPSMAADSNDWGPLNNFRDLICGTGYFNTSAEPVGVLAADTYDKTKPLSSQDITAYEKYGMSGLSVTAWLGPRKQEEMDGSGDQAGKQLVTMAGGPRALAKWGDGDSTDSAGHAKTHKAFYNTADDCNLIGDKQAVDVSNFVSKTTGGVVYATNWVYEMAFIGIKPTTAAMEPMIERVINVLKNDLYLEFLGPIVMLGALYMGWKGLVKRSSIEAGQAAVWMLASTIGGLILMANPAFIPSVATTTTGMVNSAIMSSVAQVGQDANPSDNLCALPVSNGMGQEATKTAVRIFQCENWRTFNYAPWVTAQFGSMPGSADPNNQGWNSWNTDTHGIGPDLTPWTRTMLGNKPATNQTMALTQLDNKVAYQGANTDTQQKTLLQVAANQTYFDNLSDANTIWMARGSDQKIIVTFTAFIGSLANAVVVFIPAGTIIMLSFMILIGMMSAPVFFLIGVHPGMGRRVALGWLEAMGGFVLKMITMTAFLAISNLVIHIVMGVPTQIGWIGMMAMVIIFAVALIKFLKPMLDFAGNLNLGGVSFMKGAENLHEQAAQKAARTTIGIGKTAAGFAVGSVATVAAMSAAGLSAGAGARKANKQVKEEAVAKVDAEDAAAGAGDRPAEKNAPDTDLSQVDESAAGAGDRPVDKPTVFANVAEESQASEPAGAGHRPVATETVQEAPARQPETARHVSDAEVETAAISRDRRIREAVEKAPVVNTRKAMFKASMEASRSRSIVGGFKTGTAVVSRHKAQAQSAHRSRLQQEALNAKLAEQQQQAEAKTQRDKEAAESKVKRDAARKLRDDAALVNAELAKKRSDEAKARHEARNKPGSGKHRSVGLPPLN